MNILADSDLTSSYEAVYASSTDYLGGTACPLVDM